MIKTEYTEYSKDIKLLSIDTDEIADWKYGESTNIRLSVPADIQFKSILEDRGFVMVDRMYDVSINLTRNSIDYPSMVRSKVELCDGRKDEIKMIAKKSFITDRRFHIEREYNQDKANIIINHWVDELNELYICKYKEYIAGFLAIKEVDNKTASIHLAAVDEKFRLAGIALSMYAGVIDECKKLGYYKVTGYISSRNLPVINLYTHLGAKFDKVTDIYIKEV